MSKVKYQRSNIKSQDGVSLLEVILAIAIFVVAIASVAHLIIGAQSASDYSTSKLQATLLAREKLEEVREQKNEYGLESLSEGVVEETVVLGGKDYDTILDIDCFEVDEYCVVESTVSWTVRDKEESVYFIEHLTGWEDVEVIVGE
ncbi:MAG: prepilin-type N-terminal cleavage/methylation domain-containing protein [Patescibacteria group bacterium]|jgi:prepilin-type N-terminal cleavage/methylation domain-containing protein|nr:prepilin-type N-terminal cleavage/methylation domain-containing protein [Patescibacteria group bacterium]